jgi:hypothetical protein
VRLLAWNGVGERGHRHDPQAPARVERDLHGVLEVRKLLFRSEEIQRIAVGDRQIGLLLS